MTPPADTIPLAAKFAAKLRRLYPRATRRAVSVKQKQTAESAIDFAKYRDDPVGFIRDVLGVTLTEPQERIARACPGSRVKVNAGHSTGKAENVKTVIDTPDGRCYFGDLRPGDRVFGADGRPIKVLAVHPQGVIPQYRVTFNDGAYVLCSGEHLWNVQGRQQRRPGSLQFGWWLTLTTAEIKARGLYRHNGTGGASMWTIPRQGAAQYEARPVGVDAYTMGYWLGNGTVGTGGVTRGDDPEITGWLVPPTTEGTREFPDPDSAAVKVTVYGLKVALDAAGVLNTPTDQKRVPDDYRENTITFRHALLQGLMDSDGTIDKRGSSGFTSTSLGLVRDVIWLVRSLGGRASLHPTVKQPWMTEPDGTRKYHKPAYNCTVSHDTLPLFRLKRKQDRVRVRGRTADRFIESIEPEGSAEMMCITVDAPDGLYQTRGFVVTHNTFLAACICLWWFNTRDPCVIITTAPTERDVIDLLWTEIRLLHMRAKIKLPAYFIGPRAPEMFDHDEHWGKGYTSRSGDSFQGRHRPHMLFVFDESEGVQPVYWTTTNTMYKPDDDHCWLAIGNPTTTSSQSYMEDLATDERGGPKWKLHTLSALDHPNIAAGLAGLPLPVPNAISVGQVAQFVKDWATLLVPGADSKPHDFVWPPESRIVYRPGPLFLSRVLGIRPVSGVDTVWSDEAWEMCLSRPSDPASCWLSGYGITIGCDVATYGDDLTAITVRCGPMVLHHEAHNGWLPDRVAARLKALCAEWCAWYNARSVNPDRPHLKPQDVVVQIELDGPGVGVLSHATTEYPNWLPVSVASASEVLDPLGRACYMNRRSEIWVEASKLALAGGIDLSYLPVDVLARLRLQLLTPSYHIDQAGRTVVEAKKDVKERLGRSPDDADALLICFAKTVQWSPSVVSRGSRE